MLSNYSNHGQMESKEALIIIGGGWYGSHLALHLSLYYSVTLLEKNNKLFSEISGQFGIRLHTGPHYPRSSETRTNCRIGHDLFKAQYPDLVNEHSHSVYAYGVKDTEEKPPKIDQQTFRNICFESGDCIEVDMETSGYENIHFAMDISKEPSLVLGSRLRNSLTKKLQANLVEVKCNFTVTGITKQNGRFEVSGLQSDEDNHINAQEILLCAHVINATSFKFNIPASLPCSLRFVYQVCLALVYRINTPQEKPLSFIVMDGWFPCLMPYDIRNDTAKYINTYVMTHAKYTNIMTSHNLTEAENFLKHEVPSLIGQIKIMCEADMTRFWPTFLSLFQYCGFKGVVLAKPVAEGEFRSALAFKDNRTEVIHIFPGKVSDICIIEKEVEILLQDNPALITIDGEFRYTTSGTIDTAKNELSQELSGDRNTSELQSYRELQSASPPELFKDGSAVFSRTRKTAEPSLQETYSAG